MPTLRLPIPVGPAPAAVRRLAECRADHQVEHILGTVFHSDREQLVYPSLFVAQVSIGMLMGTTGEALEGTADN